MKYVFFAILALCAGTGNAADAPDNGPCSVDRKTLCPDAQFGPESFKCLKNYEMDLSTGCKHFIGNMGKRRDEMKQGRDACKSDMDKLCPGLKGNERRACIQKNSASFSDVCKAAMSKLGERQAGIRNQQAARFMSCKADMDKSCPGLKGEELRDCMANNAASFSDACKSAMADFGRNRPEFAKRRAACKDDMEKLCPGLEGPDMFKCMRDNKDKLSDKCKAAMPPVKVHPGEESKAAKAAVAAPAAQDSPAPATAATDK
jgi:hypothetical protein